MPIRPENRDRYPDNWKEIREGILARAENKCEFCGVANYALGKRNAEGKFREMSAGEAEAAAVDGEKVIKIVLTIAHLDHTPEHNDPMNLRALCQRCHLHYDKSHHAETRRNNVDQGMFNE